MTMSRNTNKTLAVLLFACSAVAQERITVHVGCDQGICEGEHTVTVTVQDDQRPSNEYTVTVYVPEYSDSESIAAELAAKLNSVVPPAILCAPAKTAEVDRPSNNPPRHEPPSADDKLKRHDLVLPPCLKYVRSSHTRNGRRTTTGQVTVEPAKEFKLSLAARGEMLLNVAGCQAGAAIDLGVFGRVVPADRSTGSFPLATTGHPLAAVGRWLTSTYGASVRYPTETSLTASFDLDQGVWFGFAAVREMEAAEWPLTYTESLAFSLTFFP